MRGPVSLVLVDFDDTLVDTAPRFLNARRALFALLRELGFEDEVARQIHRDVADPEMMVRHGLGPRRLEHSFRHTYHLLCDAFGRIAEPHHAQRCADAARDVAGTPPLLSGALDALRRLANAHHTALYTQAGDASYQLECVIGAGITEILPVDRIVIRERKTDDAFREVLQHYAIADARSVWMIGNSMRSDINPALACGANAIHVATAEVWEYDAVDPVSPDYISVDSFVDAVDYLLKLEA